jgi:hypothetical protein
MTNSDEFIARRRAEGIKAIQGELQGFCDAMAGESYPEAARALAEEGLDYRIVKLNDVPQICTRDYKPLRFNFEVKGDIIERAYLG